MPQSHDPDDDDGLAVTRAGDESTQAESLEATEVDPFATALPTDSEVQAIADAASVIASPVDSTLEDTYATRFTDVSNDGFATRGTSTVEDWEPSGGSSLGTSQGFGLGAGSPRYRPMRLHARGGLGEIYVAMDGELNREVALKEIQERHLDRAESQFRFIFEAEVTGGLEHPGIVPVYGLGRHADGRPYYAMRFIRGDSLKAAIKAFHDSGQARGLSSSSIRHSLELRLLLRRFVDVCHAIDYAHGRGVLHRDIKPDNIMLGSHGETLVVDWGLAKALNRPDPPDTSSPRPLRPLSGGDTSATMVGAVMGTPAFMSPEQASGEVDALGPASDIFSLGSTLYALLVGVAPFRDKGLTELLDHVRRAEFPSLRSINPAIPIALQAICLKAMARSIDDRYPSAAALAIDIERWLADEPVEAYPEPWATRWARWARRHRTAVASAFVLLLTVAIALGISTFLIDRERARADRNYQRARSAVEQMLTKVGEVDLADVPQMESVRRDLLDRALGFYREFLNERGSDQSSTLETARALTRLGDIREMLGLYVQAESHYREALMLLSASTSRDAERTRTLARARAGLGVLLKKSNRFAESETMLHQALIDRRDLAKANPENLEDARASASTLYQLGTLLARLRDRSKEDEAFYREAIADQERLTNQPGSGQEARRDLARYLNNLGILQAGSDPSGAKATFLRAVKIQDELQADSAANAGFRWQRARTWNNLGILATRGGIADEAEAGLTKARLAFESLSSDFPKVPDYRRELAMTLNNLGLFLESQPPGPVKPLDLFRKAQQDQRFLVLEFPEVPDHRLKLALTCLHLGDLLRSADPVGAEAAFAEAIPLQTKLANDTPQVPEYQAALGRTLTEQALLVADQARYREAVAILARAIEALDQAVQGNPREPTYVRFLIEAHNDRALSLLKLGLHAELAEQAERLSKVDLSRPNGFLIAAGYLVRCAELAASDTTLTEPNRRELGESYAKKAVQTLRQAIDREPRDPSDLDAPGLKPLKGRPDFEKLREDWNAKGRKAAV